MMNKVSEEPRALGSTAYGLTNENDMYWNCEETNWKGMTMEQNLLNYVSVICRQLASEVKSSEVVLRLTQLRIKNIGTGIELGIQDSVIMNDDVLISKNLCIFMSCITM